MKPSPRILAALVVTLGLAGVASAQTPAPRREPVPSRSNRTAYRPAYNYVQYPHPSYESAARRPYVPYHSSYDDYDSGPGREYRTYPNYGYRNPGGVGRRAEFYPPGNHFQNEGVTLSPGQFGNGGLPSRADQLDAVRTGIQHDRMLNSQMGTYGAPLGGFGLGYGLGFGFGLPFR